MLTEESIAKIEKLKEAISSDRPNFTVTRNEDDFSVTYSLSESDAQGNVRNFTDRRAKPREQAAAAKDTTADAQVSEPATPELTPEEQRAAEVAASAPGAKKKAK